MNNKSKNSKAGVLIIILLVVIAAAVLYSNSPLYYKSIIGLLSSYQSGNTEKTKLAETETSKPQVINEDIRTFMAKGGNINFGYNYIPSERAYDTMYSYSLYRYSATGDCTFYCTRYTLEKGSEDLCNCLYSESIWNELLSLILDHGELIDCTSIYDANGKVVSTPIKKAVSLANGVYSPHNIDNIEAYFKKLAVNAGVEASELNKNIPIDDDKIVDKNSVTDLNGNFLYNPIGGLTSEETQQLEAYLWEKYKETGVRMYIILYNTDDTDAITNVAKKMFERATSPAIAFGLTASKRTNVVRFKMDKNRESLLRENYSQIGEAYITGNSTYEKLIKAIDKAYELY